MATREGTAVAEHVEPERPLIVDAHLDLAMNALEYGRSLLLPLEEIRRREGPDGGPGGAGVCTVTIPALREAGVFLCGATVYARVGEPTAGLSGCPDQAAAYGVARGHLAYYEALARQGVIRIVTSADGLAAHRREWRDGWAGRRLGRPAQRSAEEPASPPLGIILLMECADPLLHPGDVERWAAAGLRAVGPAHFGPNIYAHGTGSEGGLTPGGRELLRIMEGARLVLDVSHLADQAFWEAMDAFRGPVMASHSNCRALAPGPRQLDDGQIKTLIERDAVIGIALETAMLAGERGRLGGREAVGWDDVAAHIDHICQLAGSSRHVGLGTDLDGGFGRERVPAPLDSVRDVPGLAHALADRGYGPDDVTAIMGGNWLRFWERVL